MFCRKCGANIGEETKCPYCGYEHVSDVETETTNNTYEHANQEQYEYNTYTTQTKYCAKSRLVAGLLQLFLGFFGVGRFYLGYVLYGILQIVVTVVTCGIGGILWGFIDGLLILCRVVNTDARGMWLDN